MKTAILCSLAASAAAFAPQTQSSKSRVELNEFANGYVGGAGPEPMFVGKTGSTNFDPLNLSGVSSSLCGLRCFVTGSRWTLLWEASSHRHPSRIRTVTPVPSRPSVL